MESVDAKMIRAHEHLELLAREVSEYLSTVKIQWTLKTAPGVPNPWLVVWANDYIPPVRLSVLLGDCVHNMRGALDNLVCGLAQTVTPHCGCSGLAFPFSENDDDWDRKVKKGILSGVPPEAQEVIKELQPWPDKLKTNPLIMLNKLSNYDKHRACNFTLTYSRNTVFRVHANNGTVAEISYKNPIYLGDVQTVMLPVPAAAVTPSARVQVASTFSLSLREEGLWEDLPVIQVLPLCIDHLETAVIGKLKPFFAR